MAWALFLTCVLAASAQAARVALVIGNDTYANVARLKNARADAKAMAKALEGSGFRVTLVMDADREAMNEALRRFRASIVGGDEAVFSYAGHAVELDGVNYLLPTDIRDDNDERVANDALALQRVLSGLAQQKPRFSLVIIDACRDNPFEGKTRNVATRGLVPAAAAVKGQMIIYSAGAGQRALDRLRADDSSANGVFTRVFVREIEKGGQPVHEVVRVVKDEVMRLAESVGHEQMPAIYDQSVGTFYFRKGAVGATTDQEQRGDGDEAYWQEARRLETVEGYEAYLEAYPKGKYNGMARAAKKKLTVAAPASPTTTSVPGMPVAGRTFRDCPTCPEMVVIPGGSFSMGSTSSDPKSLTRERPLHRVQVKSFALGKHELSRGEFRRFVAATGRLLSGCWTHDGKKWKDDTSRSWDTPGYAQQDDHPVACVSWEDAKSYAAWLSRMTGKDYRLASESEWEYAARGGSKESRHWGSGVDDACRYANVRDLALQRKRESASSGVFPCDDNYAETAPVGSFEPNGFGLKDMLGNLSEWVEDCDNETYNGAPEDGSAWTAGDCSRRVIRGSNWFEWRSQVRSAHRDSNLLTRRFGVVGFRLARTLP